MGLNRKPTEKEIKLIDFLVSSSTKKIPGNWRDFLMVRSMNDGEVGSLYLFPDGKIIENRVFGEEIGSIHFKDLDNIDVIASLNVDTQGNLFELDIFKTDFGNLLHLPDF